MTTLAKLTNSPLNAVPSLIEKFFDDDFMNWGMRKGFTVPDVNIKDTKDDYIIEVAAPGMNKDDFEINYDKEQLYISVSRKDDKKEEEENYLRREYNYQSFQRSFHVPERLVDADNIKAKYENGILYITVPKKEEAKPKPAKKIKIS